jgi:hypothetical protein
MKSRLEQYQNLMRSTRGLSVAGAVIVIFAGALDLYGIYIALSLADGAVFEDHDLVWNVAKRAVMLLVVIAVFVLRVVMLRSSSSRSAYYKSAGSWLFATAIAMGYVWLTSVGTPTEPNCIPSDGEICFAIYDMSSSFAWTPLVAVLYLPLSILRSLVTGLWVVIKYQYK